jgi:flagellin-like hook-associated protein FlgL
MEILKAKKTRALISIIACAILLLQATAFVSLSQACVTLPTEPLDVEADVGSIHFNGEIADFYVLVSSEGTPTNATLTAILYYDGAMYDNLTSLVQYVETGLYRIPYNIPGEASAGTYALVVNANYYTVEGTTLKSFLLSQTLTGWNAWLTEIRNNVAIIKTDVGTIQVSLENVNATIVSIEENVVTIETDIGIIKTDINTLQVDVTAIQNNIVTIETNIGEMQVNLTQLNSVIVELNGTVVNIQTDIGIV